MASRPITILMADDDDVARDKLREAWAQTRVTNDLRFVPSTDALLDYLLHRGDFSNAARAPRPGLIILEPQLDDARGFDALAEIKAHSELRQIPIVALTTIADDAALNRAYDLGANSVVAKPDTFAELLMIVREVGQYWCEVVSRPKRN